MLIFGSVIHLRTSMLSAYLSLGPRQNFSEILQDAVKGLQAEQETVVQWLLCFFQALYSFQASFLFGFCD